MIDNSILLEELMTEGIIRVRDNHVLHEAPPALPGDTDFDKVEGMLLGLAIGDSLGATTESMFPAIRKEEYGEIRDYQENEYAEGKRVGLPTDDTQLAFWTLEQLLADRGFVPDNLASRFCKNQIYGIGSAVRSFTKNYGKKNCPWEKAGTHTMGNGALMRIAPVLVPYLRKPGDSLWADAAINTMITHNEYGNVATSVAFVKVLWSLLGMKSTPVPGWWLDTFCSTAKALEGNTCYHPRHDHIQYEGELWRFTDERVKEAMHKKLSIVEACDWWASGAYLLETVPSVLYILASCADDPEEAIIRAVNDTKDNDTIAAIVGAAVGALHGAKALPARWKEGLLGRTCENDDGKVFELIAMAEKTFWEGA